MFDFTPATKPTLYFIGVTTEKSSIMKVFPKWAGALGLGDVAIKGIDLPLHAPAEDYRKVTQFLKDDPLSAGALVTTHKLDLFKACEDLFDDIDPFAEKLEEVSSLSKSGGKFRAHAKDPISSGLALEHFVPADFWRDHGGEVLLLGAGGSSLAMSIYFGQERWGDNVPKAITIANRSVPRLESAKKTLAELNPGIDLRLVHGPSPADNDRLVSSLPPYSLIVNATGLGKDAPGSPTTDAVDYPRYSLVWEINYRGDLLFKEQAARQVAEKDLHIEDGWNYFIHGWTQVIAEVFHIEIKGALLEKLSEIARNV
jgi:shikimate 5-dehydrogenase